jgi:hypothetical protein
MQYLLQAHVDFPARTPQSKRWRRNGPLGCRRLTAGVSAQEVRHSIRNLVLGGAGAAVRSRRRTSTCARFDGRTSPIRDSATRPASFSLSRRPRTCACSRRRSGSVVTEDALRPAVCGWTNPGGQVAPSSSICAIAGGGAASSMAGSVDTSAPRCLPVFSTSLITFNTPSNLSVKRGRTEYERWVFTIGQLHPSAPWQNGHPKRLVGSIRRECVARVVFGRRMTCSMAV